MSRPNILLITADQWRGDCLSKLDHPVVSTPSLDSIADEGMIFLKHYTNAVPCGPSRACLHTGMYLHNHRSGTNGTPLDNRLTNWAKLIREAGYDPALFGYTHTAMDPRDMDANDPRLRTDEGVLPGITPVIDMATHCPDWRAMLSAEGYNLPDEEGATYGVKDTGHSDPEIPAPTQYHREHSDTAFLVSEAMKYIETQQSPWCVHLSLRAPHPPWVATAPYNELYDPAGVPGSVRQASVEMEQMTHPWLHEHLNNRRNQSHADDQRHRLLQASYYGLMSEVDTHIGLLVTQLKALKQWQDTLFIFTSDHGEQMGDHWMYGKAGYFEQSYHIPLIICGPDVTPGRSDMFTEHVDIMPTLLSQLGLEIPRQCDGDSLLPLLRGKEVTGWRNSAHYEYDFRHSETQSTLGLDMEAACLNVVRDEDYKYVHFAELPELLFDLKQDPGELNNIAKDCPEIVAKYAKMLLNWRLKSTDKTLSHLQIDKDSGLVNRIR